MEKLIELVQMSVGEWVRADAEVKDYSWCVCMLLLMVNMHEVRGLSWSMLEHDLVLLLPRTALTRRAGCCSIVSALPVAHDRATGPLFSGSQGSL